MDPHIKFTIDLPGTDGLPLLDILTKPTLNSIESTVYRKSTYTDRYLDYNFNHPISAKLSVILTLIHRAKQACFMPEFLAKEMDYLHKVLQDNHYPAQFFQQGKPQPKTHAKPSLSRSEEIGDALIDNVISKYCIPDYIIMDQDSAYMTLLMNYLFKTFDIKI